MEQIFVEKTASRGIAAAKVYKYQDPDLRPSLAGITAEQAESETERFLKARQQMIVRLQNMEDDSGILAAHIEVAKDRMLEEGVILRIREEQKNAELAVWETIDEIAGIFAGMDDPYMKEREADVRDIGKRMMAELKGVALPDLGEVSTEVIVAAADLYPSDTVKLNPKLIKGIITEKGGLTSHVSILAKSMNIPALIGVTDILSKLENGMMVCMDAEKGMIVIDPDDEVLSRCETFVNLDEETTAYLQDSWTGVLSYGDSSIGDILFLAVFFLFLIGIVIYFTVKKHRNHTI